MGRVRLSHDLHPVSSLPSSLVCSAGNQFSSSQRQIEHRTTLKRPVLSSSEIIQFRDPPVLRCPHCGQTPASDIIKPRSLLAASPQFIFFDDTSNHPPNTYFFPSEVTRVFHGISNLHPPASARSSSGANSTVCLSAGCRLVACICEWHVTLCDSCAPDLQSNAHYRQPADKSA